MAIMAAVATAILVTTSSTAASIVLMVSTGVAGFSAVAGKRLCIVSQSGTSHFWCVLWAALKWCWAGFL
jgi:hypothetical protein